MKQKNTKNCSVLVSSCDKYEDVYLPFFHFFKKHWKDCKYKVYLNTETKSYTDEDLDITTINCDKKCTWSERLKKALKKIKTEYVIFFLDDFFLLSDVKQEEIDKCIKYMEEDKDISAVDFHYSPKTIVINSNRYDGYGERSYASRYFLNCQTAIWRRKDLIKYISPYESPWQFEEFGTKRAKMYEKKFLVPQNPNTVFSYILDWVTGYGVHEGKWLKSNVELFKKEGISVDFEKMGFLDTSNGFNLCDCPPVKISARWKWHYLLYGGYEERHKMPIAKQFLYLFIHPKTFFIGVGRKIKFLFKSKEST